MTHAARRCFAAHFGKLSMMVVSLTHALGSAETHTHLPD